MTVRTKVCAKLLEQHGIEYVVQDDTLLALALDSVHSMGIWEVITPSMVYAWLGY